MTFENVIEAARIQEAQMDDAFIAEQFSILSVSQEQLRTATEWLDNCRVAELSDYLVWLKGYIDNGGEITHSYNYPFSRWASWRLAINDLEVTPLFGASSFNIIIPKGVNCNIDDVGHNVIYFIDGFIVEGAGRVVPIFSDI